MSETQVKEHPSVTTARAENRIKPGTTFGTGSTIGELSSIGHNCTIKDHVQIRDRVKIGEGVEIGSHSIIKDDVVIESYGRLLGTHFISTGAIIKDGITVSSYAHIAPDAVIEPGEWLHAIGKFYTWDSYKTKGGTIWLRYGCKTMPLEDWDLEAQNDLAHHWDIDALPELMRVVCTVRSFWGLEAL